MKKIYMCFSENETRAKVFYISNDYLPSSGK